LSDMVSTNDMSKLKEIENSVKTYRGALVGLLKTTVPTDAVQAHLHLVNATSKMLSNSEALYGTSEDPTRSLLAIGSYQNDLQELIAAMKEISLYFKNKLI